MTTPSDAARVRAALSHHLESVMSVTDTERELARFRRSVSHTRSRRRVLALAVGVAVLAAAGGTYLSVRDAGGTLPAVAGGSGAGLSGSGVLVIRDSEADASEVSRQDEYRDAEVAGPVTLSTDDGDRTVQLELTSNAGVVESAGSAAVFHGWGQASTTLDGASCVGGWASSYYRGSPDGGGSLHLACDDGTVLGATLAVERLAPHRFTGLWELHVRLADGFLREG